MPPFRFAFRQILPMPLRHIFHWYFFVFASFRQPSPPPAATAFTPLAACLLFTTLPFHASIFAMPISGYFHTLSLSSFRFVFISRRFSFFIFFDYLFFERCARLTTPFLSGAFIAAWHAILPLSLFFIFATLLFFQYFQRRRHSSFSRCFRWHYAAIIWYADAYWRLFFISISIIDAAVSFATCRRRYFDIASFRFDISYFHIISSIYAFLRHFDIFFRRRCRDFRRFRAVTLFHWLRLVSRRLPPFSPDFIAFSFRYGFLHSFQVFTLAFSSFSPFTSPFAALFSSLRLPDFAFDIVIRSHFRFAGYHFSHIFSLFLWFSLPMMSAFDVFRHDYWFSAGYFTLIAAASPFSSPWLAWPPPRRFIFAIARLLIFSSPFSLSPFYCAFFDGYFRLFHISSLRYFRLFHARHFRRSSYFSLLLIFSLFFILPPFHWGHAIRRFISRFHFRHFLQPFRLMPLFRHAFDTLRHARFFIISSRFLRCFLHFDVSLRRHYAIFRHDADDISPPDLFSLSWLIAFSFAFCDFFHDATAFRHFRFFAISRAPLSPDYIFVAARLRRFIFFGFSLLFAALRHFHWQTLFIALLSRFISWLIRSLNIFFILAGDYCFASQPSPAELSHADLLAWLTPRLLISSIFRDLFSLSLLRHIFATPTVPCHAVC